MVLTRAFACATPVVASDIPGYRDVMTTRPGCSCRRATPAALADALVRCSSDEQRRRALGANARARRQEHYGWDGIARRLLGIYERVLDANRRRRSPHEARSRRARGPAWRVLIALFVLVAGCSTGAAPNGAPSPTRSGSSQSDGSSPRSSSTCSPPSRARSPGRPSSDEAIPDDTPQLLAHLLRLRIGLLANAVLPGRIGEFARVGVLDAEDAGRRGRDADAARHRLRAPRLRRDPVADPDRLRPADGEDPALGDHEPVIVAGVGVVLFGFAIVSGRLDREPLAGRARAGAAPARAWRAAGSA